MRPQNMHHDLGVPIETKTIRYTIKLPHVKKFKARGGSDKEFPLLKFYTFLAKELGVESQDLNPSEVVVSLNTGNALLKFTKQWVIKNTDYMRGSHRLEITMGMINLQYGPVFSDSKTVLDNEVYIVECPGSKIK